MILTTCALITNIREKDKPRPFFISTTRRRRPLAGVLRTHELRVCAGAPAMGRRLHSRRSESCIVLRSDCHARNEEDT